MDIDKVEKLVKPQPTINHHNNNDGCWEKKNQRSMLIPPLTKKRVNNYGISWISFKMYLQGIKEGLVVAM